MINHVVGCEYIRGACHVQRIRVLRWRSNWAQLSERVDHRRSTFMQNSTVCYWKDGNSARAVAGFGHVLGPQQPQRVYSVKIK